MKYISSVGFSGAIDAVRLMTMERGQANDYKLHTLKRLYLLSKLGEITNDIDRLEMELVDLVTGSSIGAIDRKEVDEQNRRIDHLISYRQNILRGLEHEDNFLSKFGPNKPFIPSWVYFEQLKSRSSADTTLDDLLTARLYVLSKIGEINDVINKINVLIVMYAQNNDQEQVKLHALDRVNFNNKLRKAFAQLRALDQRIKETKQ